MSFWEKESFLGEKEKTKDGTKVSFLRGGED